MNEINKRSFGNAGEDLAEKLLRGKGFEIVDRNYQFGHGEIDIVAKDKGCLVFVEVKTRTNLEYGEPEYAITRNKIKQMKKMAELYLYDKKIIEADCRFDVVAILLTNEENPIINHYENAF
jgi:putative endonuclease